jgi:Lar family restriction alleviation protein
MMEELKKCPFCGFDEANIYLETGRYGDFVYCQCELCGASSKSFAISAGDLSKRYFWETTAADKAIAAWNRRCADAE